MVRGRLYLPTFFLNETFLFVGGCVNPYMYFIAKNVDMYCTDAHAHRHGWMYSMCSRSEVASLDCVARTFLRAPYPVAPLIVTRCQSLSAQQFICGRPDSSKKLGLRRIHIQYYLSGNLWLLKSLKFLLVNTRIFANSLTLQLVNILTLRISNNNFWIQSIHGNQTSPGVFRESITFHSLSI